MNGHVLSCFLTVLFTGLVFAQTDNKPPAEERTMDCKVCHLCENPTAADPCLRECPRFKEMTMKAGRPSSPEVIVIDVLSKLYVPVVFSHRFHAEMSEMSDGCSLCHHHNPSRAVLSCRFCHPVSPLRADLSNPSLRGAYHRQCLGCHREWSHQTACSVCHALKSSQTEEMTVKDTTDIMGLSHPPIKVPDKIIFDTGNKEGPLVTFYHNEHTGLFGLKCTQCHREEGCGKCHDLTKEKAGVQAGPSKSMKISGSDQAHHKACDSCHKKNKCNFCHAKSAKAPFNHYKRTAWDQKKYHFMLTCDRCHVESGRFIGLKGECTSCHKQWTPDNFKHDLTGFRLDENHQDLECGECHQNNSYLQVPVCTNCHDEDFIYPAKKPGQDVHNN